MLRQFLFRKKNSTARKLEKAEKICVVLLQHISVSNATVHVHRYFETNTLTRVTQPDCLFG
jgi:hypothetical protein